LVGARITKEGSYVNASSTNQKQWEFQISRRKLTVKCFDKISKTPARNSLRKRSNFVRSKQDYRQINVVDAIPQEHWTFYAKLQRILMGIPTAMNC